jgi:hypothetical protein
MVPSTDLHGANTKHGEGSMSYIEAQALLHAMISENLAVAFPTVYARYRKAFEAARWSDGDAEKGAFIGKAIVWKMKVGQHRDKNDGPLGICASVCSGSFEGVDSHVTGAPMILPDLGLAFA